MKTTVIYHSADFDGIFCREIARKFLPYAELIGWNHGDKPLEIPLEGQIYILDLPVDRVFGDDFSGKSSTKYFCHNEMLKRVIWIDHHKSSIESHPTNIAGYRIDGVAACRLAWQWFAAHERCAHFAEQHPGELPCKTQYIDRQVSEPLAVRLAGEYDIWDKLDPRAELFQHGLRSQPLNRDCWRWLLGVDCAPQMTVSVVERLLQQGEYIQYAKTSENESVIKDIGFNLEWEGLKFLACNAARYNSHLFTTALKPEHDACLGFKWAGKDWSVSLYHAPGREHHDLSLIAKKHGGGGHRGACGFQAKTLPFI